MRQQKLNRPGTDAELPGLANVKISLGARMHGLLWDYNKKN